MSLVDSVMRRTYGRRRFQRLYRRLHSLALVGLNYGCEDPVLNGEYALLDRMAGTWNDQSVVVFDVGAFHGTWSAAVLDRAAAAKVYAFEPVSTSFAELAENLGGRGDLNNCALGAAAGNAEIFAPLEVPELASLHHRDLSNFSLAADSLGSVPVQTIDVFCAEREITHIDLLKLDTEGHELSVLTGARRLLDTRAIEAIQFEFGGANIDAKVFLRDIIGVLAPEFEVFRLLRDGLAPARTDEREEIFTYANFVALRGGAV